MEDQKEREVFRVSGDTENKQIEKESEGDQNRKLSYVISPLENERDSEIEKINDKDRRSASIFGRSQDSDQSAVSHKTFDVDQKDGKKDVAVVQVHQDVEQSSLIDESRNESEDRKEDISQSKIEKNEDVQKDATFEEEKHSSTPVESERKIRDWLLTTTNDEREKEMEKDAKSSDQSDHKTEDSGKKSIQRATSLVNLSDLRTKRNQLHTDWFEKKEQLLKQQKQRQIILEEQKEKLKREKENQSRIVYESWKKLKDEQIKIRRKMISESMVRKEREEKEFNEQKRQDALKVFGAWKKSKGAQSKGNAKKEDKLAEEQEARKKKEDAKLVFDQWKKSKDQEIQNKLISIKRSELVKKKEENQLCDERRRLADLAYEQWLESKDFQEFVAEQVELGNHGYGNGEYSVSSFSENFKIPWLPPSRFVFDKKNLLFRSRKRSRASSAKVRAH